MLSRQFFEQGAPLFQHLLRIEHKLLGIARRGGSGRLLENLFEKFNDARPHVVTPEAVANDSRSVSMTFLASEICRASSWSAAVNNRCWTKP